MKSSLKKLSISLGLVLLTTVLSTAQLPAEPEKEFRSIGGRFGIVLPPDYADYKAAVPLQLSGKQFYLSIYRWSTAAGQFSIAYAVDGSNLEATGQASSLLTNLRASSAHTTTGTNLLGERQIDIDGHPGFELIAESAGTQIVTQFF